MFQQRLGSAIYTPFGTQSETRQPTQTTEEQKGTTRQRYDADAGLQYLNARYYDPLLGMFIQPDWWEVTKPGMGTNRYSYSFNDPVNRMDPGGNQTLAEAWGNFTRALGDFFSGAVSGASKNADLNNTKVGIVGGATTGALIGGSTGLAAGCAGSACLASPATGPAGAGAGGLLGCLLGGLFGLGADGADVVAGAIDGGIACVRTSCSSNAAGSDGTKVLATPDTARGSRLLGRLLGMTSTGLGVHGNSLMSPEQQTLYYLVRKGNPTIIDKIGITNTPGGGPSGRFTDIELTNMGVQYVKGQSYPDRLSARIAEVTETLAYVQRTGSFPKYTFSW